MALRSEWLHRLQPLDELQELVGQPVPPRSVVLDGVQRSKNRQVTPLEWEKLASRGLRVLVISFFAAGGLAADELGAFVRDHESLFQAHGPHPSEAEVYVYGRRTGKEDTRVLVVAVAT